MTGLDRGHLQPRTSAQQVSNTSQQPTVLNPRHAHRFLTKGQKTDSEDSARQKKRDRNNLLGLDSSSLNSATKKEETESVVACGPGPGLSAGIEQPSSPLKRGPSLSTPSVDTKRRQSSKEAISNEGSNSLEEEMLQRAALLLSRQKESHRSSATFPQRTNPSYAQALTMSSDASKPVAYNGFVLQPLPGHRPTAATPSERREAEGQAAHLSRSQVEQLGGGSGAHSREKLNPSTPAKAKMVTAKGVPHNRLSFGEELDEEEAQPSSKYSLANSTATRFRDEHELVLPSMASPFQAQALNGSSTRKTLGPLSFGVVQARGPRPYMEDRHTVISSFMPLSFAQTPLPDGVERSFAAIYDGHNGSKAAEHASARLHKVLAQAPAMRTCTGEASGAASAWGRLSQGSRESQESKDMGQAISRAFRQVDVEILDRARTEQGRDGSTALVVMRIGEVVWTAHAGDSRAVLSRGGKAVRLTQDHKPELVAEKARVEANGGRVDFQRCWRVICPAHNGRPASGLAVSRSFGDLDFKEPSRFIECEPDVTRVRVTAEDSYIVMASDGLWDVMSDQEAVGIAQGALDSSTSRGQDSKAAMDLRAKSAAEALLQAAQKRGSMDNVTVIVLLFHWR